MLPTAGLTDHVTAVFGDPPTVALNCWVCETPNDTLDGETDIVTGGVSVMLLVADFVGSAALVAFTVTLCAPGIVAGAVYRPEVEIVPTTGFNDQVTAVFDDPLTFAPNCWVCKTPRATLDGVIEIVTGGERATLALADFVESTALVAVTVTVCALEIEDGAV